MPSASIDVETTARGVQIVVCVGEKTARIVVTPERAQALSGELFAAALEACVEGEANV
jgi:hypothetical protein